MVSLGLQALRGRLHRPLLLLQAHVCLTARHSQEAWWGLVAGMGPTFNSQLREVGVDAGAARARALLAPGTWGWRLGCPSLVVAGVQHTFRKGWRQVSLWQGDCAAAVGRAPLDQCPWAEGVWPAPVDCWGAVCLQAAGAPCEPSWGWLCWCSVSGQQAPALCFCGAHGWGSARLQAGWQVLSARSQPLQEAATEVGIAAGRQGSTC